MENKRLKIVLDTNVFLVSLASGPSYSWIYDALIEEHEKAETLFGVWKDAPMNLFQIRNTAWGNRL